MAGAFPTLKSGNTVFYPLRETSSFGTTVAKFLDDSEQRYRCRPMLKRFLLTCTDVNAYDTALILTHFRSQFGKFDHTWTLTYGGATYSNLAFDTDAFKVTENKNNRHSISMEVIQVISDNPTIGAIGAYFPQINPAGIMTALPYTNSLEYRTTLEDSSFTGRRFGWKWRSANLGRYAVNLQALSDDEVAVVRGFFYAAEGRKKEFAFLDPGGNLIPYSDDFTNASWTKSGVSVGGTVTDPYGGSLAHTCSSGGGGSMRCTVLPAGNASGFVLTASVWARATGANQTLSIGFLDNGLADLGHTVWDLPQNVWRRIHHTVTLATNNPILAVIGGTWPSGTIQLFSAGCAPLPGPGARLLTPGFEGLRPFCRFDTDDLTINFEDFGKASANLPILEYTHA